MTLRNVIWWLFFFVLGLVFQQILPGVDLLVAGLLVALHEKNIPQLGVILFFLILLQEGLGTLDFGGAILWYGMVVSFFFVGEWLFETENWMFVLLMSLCLGLSHGALALLMGQLQYIHFDYPLLLDECILQVLATGVSWQLAIFVRRKCAPSLPCGWRTVGL